MDIFDEILKYFLLFLVGCFSGFINVIAGGGSMITLPLLMGFGMPAALANGTNRISILFQDIAGIIKFLKAKKLPVRTALILGIPTILGAAAGAMFASKLSQMLLSIVILILLIAMTVYIILKPPVVKCNPEKEEKTESSAPHKKIGIFTFIIFLIIGVYAGFIQVGSTLIWYAILTWKMKLGFISANATKLFLNCIMTPIALVIFIIHHQVAFVDGSIIGVGSFLGAWLSAKIAMKLSAKAVKIMMLTIFISAAVYVLLFKIIHI